MARASKKPGSRSELKCAGESGRSRGPIFILLAAASFVVVSVWPDATSLDGRHVAILAILLTIVLAFEFINGFHDTANAVTTVIYTHSLAANRAVVWSGLFNFLGVLISTGGVAFGIASLFPVEPVLELGRIAGFAMVLAVLLTAILWNLGTWYVGLPSSSTHTLIGSIMGVGIASAVLRDRSAGTGIDWAVAREIGEALLISPLIGFGAAALLQLVLRALVRNPALYGKPVAGMPPPWWIRGLLMCTCAGVSFAHGSNDGQKGMGMIMLILVATLPAAYAFDRALPRHDETQFHIAGAAAAAALPQAVAPTDPRRALIRYVVDHHFDSATLPALRALILDIDRQVWSHGGIAHIPPSSSAKLQTETYLVASAIRKLAAETGRTLEPRTRMYIEDYRRALARATQFIPVWVKIAVAIALGLGTLIGWKRIVVTLGEKIGNMHLRYSQGAVAELVAMSTIAAADGFNVPVSTTHVLSSGIAGTMVANRSGVQMATLRNMLMAWLLTLPASAALAGGLYAVLARFL